MLTRLRERLHRALRSRVLEDHQRRELEDLAIGCVDAVNDGDWKRAQLNARIYRVLVSLEQPGRRS